MLKKRNKMKLTKFELNSPHCLDTTRYDNTSSYNTVDGLSATVCKIFSSLSKRFDTCLV